MIKQASRPPHIYLSCGEASGDRYGAALVHALKRECPDVRVSAMGGPMLGMAGAEVVVPSEPISVMGFGEVLARWRPILKTRRQVWKYIDQGDVDVVVPVDFPGFNLRLAAHAKKKGLPVFYVVPPQLWAWGSWRLRKLRRNVDQVGTILPFEQEWFSSRKVNAIALGHPLMEDYSGYPFEAQRRSREDRMQDPDTPLTVGIMPGSRQQEIERLLPLMKVTAGIIQTWLGRRRVRVVVSQAPGVDLDRLAAMAGEKCEITDEPLPMLYEKVDLAMVCSGTASLEASLAGVPHAVVYRTSSFNFSLARRLVKVPYIGLANLILDRPMAPEHIQDDADPAHLAGSLLAFLNTPGRRDEFYRDCNDLRKRCGGAGVWRRTARAILNLLEHRKEG